jgi:hypothetical protein
MKNYSKSMVGSCLRGSSRSLHCLRCLFGQNTQTRIRTLIMPLGFTDRSILPTFPAAPGFKLPYDSPAVHPKALLGPSGMSATDLFMSEFSVNTSANSRGGFRALGCCGDAREFWIPKVRAIILPMHAR